MIYRPKQAFLLVIIIAALVLSACQDAAATITPSVEVKATPARGMAEPEDMPAATQPPQPAQLDATVPAVPDPTRAPSIDLAVLDNLAIDFWHPYQGELAQALEAAVKEFNRDNTWGLQVRVRSFYNPSALVDAVAQARSQDDGEFPEVVAASSEQLAGWAQESPALIVDLTPYAADAQLGLEQAEIAAYEPVFWSQDQSGGQRLGLPALRNARVLFYNQSWAEDLGFSAAPVTPQEFREQACAAAVENSGSGDEALFATGGWLIDTDPLTTLSWLAAFGAEPIPAQEGQPYAFESPQAETALEFLREMVTDGCAWIGRSLDDHEYFALRRALFIAGSLPEIHDQARWQAQTKSGDRWTVIPFPAIDGEPVLYSGGDSYGVTSIDGTAGDAQLAGWLFARWMAQPQTAAKLAQALPSLPISAPVAANLADYQNNPPWDQILPLMDGLRPAPALASWLQARRLLEDAAWQVYHLPPESLPEVLPQLDLAVQELVIEAGNEEK